MNVSKFCRNEIGIIKYGHVHILIKQKIQTLRPTLHWDITWHRLVQTLHNLCASYALQSLV